MCSARVDPVFVVRGFMNGNDGVMVLGCHFGDCHYATGNYYTEKRMQMLGKLLKTAGLCPERLYVDWVSAAEGTLYVDMVSKFTDRVRDLGPLGEGEDEKKNEIGQNLAAAERTLQSERIRWLVGNEKQMVEDENVYGEKVTQEDFDEVMDAALQEEYVRSHILLLTEREPLSAKDIAKQLQQPVAEIVDRVVDLLASKLISLADVQEHSPRYVAAT